MTLVKDFKDNRITERVARNYFYKKKNCKKRQEICTEK